ncbi:hypothetical protein [Marinimicrobium sp. ABcell2]|uniref:hypothetical protein n=1 Tax=Marinimicrobium sp. ABcell2 TaxID=3069751 RepID=UPI0027B55BDE|nr:hypothetical protein [Marinimicrobium sp. ABcell2]MDQ2077946.1 hypothetical protein [Marinimicrobium sp. ABcell2]
MEEGLAASFMWAWGAYLLGAVGLLLTGWRITRRMPRDWRHLLLVSVAALLLTPTALSGMDELVLVPALFVLVLEGLFDDVGGALHAGMLILGVWLVGLILSLIYQFCVRPPKRSPQS